MILLAAETVFQQIAQELDFIGLMIFAALVMLIIIATGVWKIINAAKETATLQREAVLALRKVAERGGHEAARSSKPPPVPDALTLTDADLREAARYTESLRPKHQ